MSNDARQLRIGEIYEVKGDSACSGTRDCNTVVIVDHDVLKPVNLLRTGLYGRDKPRIHDDRAATCRSHSLPFGQIHVVDRIEYPIAVSHCRGPGRVGRLELSPGPSITSTPSSRFWAGLVLARATSQVRRRAPVVTEGTSLPRKLTSASLRTGARAQYGHFVRADDCRHGRAVPRVANSLVHHQPTSR